MNFMDAVPILLWALGTCLYTFGGERVEISRAGTSLQLGGVVTALYMSRLLVLT